jgi:hypothetical protein
MVLGGSDPARQLAIVPTFLLAAPKRAVNGTPPHSIEDGGVICETTERFARDKVVYGKLKRLAIEEK